MGGAGWSQHSVTNVYLGSLYSCMTKAWGYGCSLVLYSRKVAKCRDVLVMTMYSVNLVNIFTEYVKVGKYLPSSH